MSELVPYFTALLDGMITACDKMKRASEMILDGYENPGEYHFDPEIAEAHISFIEKFCKVPAGNIGEPLKLEQFQKARLEAVFGFVDDNDLRQYNEVIIIEGRKNGKTTECAAVEIDLVMNDDEGAPEVYNIATKYEQAMKGFNAANNMRRQSPSIAKHLKKRASDLYCKYNMGFIKAMASNVKSLDSLDAHAVICARIERILILVVQRSNMHEGKRIRHAENTLIHLVHVEEDGFALKFWLYILFQKYIIKMIHPGVEHFPKGFAGVNTRRA